MHPSGNFILILLTAREPCHSGLNVVSHTSTLDSGLLRFNSSPLHPFAMGNTCWETGLHNSGGSWLPDCLAASAQRWYLFWAAGCSDLGAPGVGDVGPPDVWLSSPPGSTPSRRWVCSRPCECERRGWFTCELRPSRAGGIPCSSLSSCTKMRGASLRWELNDCGRQSSCTQCWAVGRES